MMKLAVSVAVIQSILVGGLLAELAPPSSMWQPFYSEKLKVEWGVATNSLPSTVAVFKVVPASFSSAVISNVVRMTSFTSSDRIKSFDPEENVPAGTIAFQSQDERKSLSFVPFYGTIILYAPDSSWPREDFEQVPDEARAYELGTNILRQLELPLDEVQHDDGHHLHAVFNAGTTRHGAVGSRPGDPVPHAFHLGPSLRNMMGVTFGRQLDNIASDLNPRALRIEFGAHERVTRLELTWPKVQAEKRYPVTTAGQIMAWIKEGRARVQSLSGPMDARVVGPPDIKRLIIKQIRLHYSPFNFPPEHEGEKPADRLYPYAVLDAEAEFGPGDIETFPLFCPVIPEELPAVSHESLGISIYPSKQNQRSKLAPSEQTTR